MELNYLIGGMMGDFIHSLFVIKNQCQNNKANIYITDKYGGDNWAFGLEKSYTDLYNLIISQPYVNKFEIATTDIGYINLNTWRVPQNGFVHNWSNMLFTNYNFTLNGEYKWLTVNKTNQDLNNKVLLHKSIKRHNVDFNWEIMINSIEEEKLFITSSIEEWNNFPYKNMAKLYFISSIEELAVSLNSCKMFIGNQSAPFAIASALDINRFVELDKWGGAVFYMGEEKYSNKISWFLNNSQQFYSSNSLVNKQ